MMNNMGCQKYVLDELLSKEIVLKPLKSQEYSFLLNNSLSVKNNQFNPNNIKDVIFNNPATIVFWKDGTKTVVKCQKDKGDIYNPELGLAMCIIKKMCGNKGNFNDIFTKWLPK